MYCYLWSTKIIRVLYLKVHCKLHGQNDKTFSIKILPPLKKFTFSPDVYWGKFSNLIIKLKQSVNFYKNMNTKRKSSWVSINIWNYLHKWKFVFEKFVILWFTDTLLPLYRGECLQSSDRWGTWWGSHCWNSQDHQSLWTA